MASRSKSCALPSVCWQTMSRWPCRITPGAFSRLAAGTLAGVHPWRSAALDGTGAKVVAVERDGEVLVEFDDGFTLRDDDALFVCGSTNSLDRYQREFEATPAPQARA